jgi:VWFA-related protein
MDVHGRFTNYLLRLLPILILLILPAPSFSSQVQTPPSGQKGEKSDKAVRAGVGLVQTDVLVFDRQGRFADDLKRDQFELLVGGRPQPISFFELVTAGSPEEARQWGRAQGTEVPASSQVTGSTPDGGRTLFFFLDDLHMSADSIKRVREALLHFIDAVMGVHDRAAIVAATRQIGFMQQLSNDKSVLCAAVEQLTFRQQRILDDQQPAMNEAQALAIEQNDSSVLASFVNPILAEKRQSGKAARERAEQIVRRRAAALAKQSVNATYSTLLSLSDLLRSHAALPGRKLVFVLSDGFVLKGGLSDATERLLQMTEAAARAGIVIYALDAGGPEAGRVDASDVAAPEPTGGRPLSVGGETFLPPDGPRVLVAATGGRFLPNTGALGESIVKVLTETSRYYLLGWRVEPAMLQSGNSKSLKVIVKDHPDLTVRLRQTSIDLSQYVWAENEPVKDEGPDHLFKAIRSPNPLTALPVFLYAGYTYDPDKGQVLQILVQIAYEAIVAAVAPKEDTSIEVMGAVLNKNGATADFFQSSLSVPMYSTSQSKEKQADLIRSRSVAIEPGIYQVRIAARDSKSGRIGSANEWIEVPPFLPGKLCLSSIYLAEQQVQEASPTSPVSETLPEKAPSIRRLFSALSRLPFYVYFYNYVRPSDGAPPSFLTRVKIYKGDQAVIQSPLQPLQIQAGPGEGLITYSATVLLKGLQAGPYILEVTAIDRSNSATAIQRVSFWIR